MKIQKPTKGRVVLFTALSGDIVDEERKLVEFAALVVDTHPHIAGATVDLVTFGGGSVHFKHGVPYDATGGHNTWRYPPHCKDEVEV